MCGLLGSMGSARAAAPDVPLADYILTSWTVKDGLPSNVIWSIAQDAEGYLWLGTNGGLVRFDGERFVTIASVGSTAIPKAPVRTVYSARDGSLWAGFTEAGGASRIRDGEVRTFGERDGLTGGVTTAFVEDRGGGIWAGTTSGLFRLSGDRFQKMGRANGLPETRVDSTYVDREGSLLVGTSAGVFRKPAATDTFEQIDPIDDLAPTFRGFCEDASGHLWVTDYVVGFRRLGSSRRLQPMTERGRGNRLLEDRQGDMWLATMGEGIWRIHFDASGERFSVEKARLAGARSILEDREGSIWAAAGDGLIRLTKPKVLPVTNLGLVAAVEAADDGGVWIGTADDLIRFPDGARQASKSVISNIGVRAVRADGKGGLWIATNTGLLRDAGGRTTRYLTSSGRPLTRVNALAAGANGGIWISDRDQGVFHWSDGDTAVQPMAELAATRATSMHTDRSGRVWFSSTSGRLGMIDTHDKVRTYGAQDGLGTAPYNAMYEDRSHVVWIGGSDGLSRLVDGRFVKLNWRGSVSAILEDDDGDLWLANGSGIVLLSRAELKRAIASPSYEVRHTLFDAADGLAGMPISFGSQSATRARDGTLWFVTGRGVTVIRPDTLEQVEEPSRVKIEQALADERPISAASDTQIPAGTMRLDISYTSVQLDVTHKTRFRYRLEGLDADWIDAGTNRHALYTQLPPRNYQFHVTASKTDGSWSDVGTTWVFTVPPRFYQTKLFALACVSAVAGATWAAWLLHVRRMRRHFALLLGERARLSRELHDTLLQSLVGVALQFDAVSNRLAPASPARQELVRLRRRVEEHIREARHSIWNLRLPTLQRRDLVSALRDTAERSASNQSVIVDFRVLGTPRRCGSDVEEQILRIGQEAILNAVRHARATRIDVELDYGLLDVSLRVSDDGCGFDPLEPESADHYGLVSMRERAAQIGGRLVLTSRAGSGTSVAVSISSSGEAREVA